MANAQIKITQLPNINGNNLGSNTLIPVVDTTGTAITEKVTVGNVANFILTEAGNLLPEAGVSVISYSVANAAQPNITSVGNLTGLTVTNLNNFHLPGGTNGYVLQTNGNGNLNWTAQGGGGNGNPGGANSQIQFNNSGLFAGSASLTWDAANAQLNTVNLGASGVTVYGNLATVNATVTTNLTAANANFTSTISNTISATGNITANFFLGNGSALTGITATANGAGPNNSIQYNANGVFAGDADLTWDPSTNILTANNITATANISANKASVTGNVSANIVIGNYLYGDGSNISNIVANTANYANYANFVTVESVNNNFSYHVVLTTGPGDSSLHSDADDNFQYNPVDGTMTVTRVDAQFVQAGNVISNLIPFSNITYDLGSNTHRWKDIWLSNSTIYLGDSTLSANGNSVIVSGLTITDGNIGNIGNIASINLNGSNSNVLYGNGVFAPAGGGGGNVSELVNGLNSFVLDTDGNVVFEGNGAGQGIDRGVVWDYGANANGVNSELRQDNFGITVRAYTENGGGANGYSAAVNIVTNQGPATNTWSFDGQGNLTLPANTFAVNYANGTAVTFGAAALGNVTFDDVTVQGDNNSLNLSAGSDFTANLAYLQVRAGDVASHIHLDTGNNQAYDLIVGDDQNYVQVSSTGNILLSSYDSNTAQYIWTLDYNGNLILAGGNGVIQSIANSSLDPLSPNASTMVLTPDQSYSSQALVLDPTFPGHIHLRAPSANIDEPSANIFLGGETSSFEVGYHNGAAPNLFIHSGNNTWTFDNAGNLTFPRDAAGNIDPILSIVSGATPTIVSTDASLTGPANLAIQSDYLNLSGSTGNRIILQADAGAIATDAAMVLSTNLADPGNIVSWTLDTTGNLYLPDTTSVIANVSITLEANDSGNITGLSVIGDANANLYAHNNVKIVSDSSNTTATWTFDIDGNLILPQLTTISDESVIGTTLTVGVPPTVIVISGADFSPVNTTYTKTGAATPTWEPAGYNPATDPYIEFTGGQYGIFVPGFGQALYINTGTLNIPLAQWNTNPPLGSIAPTAIYTYGTSGPDWVFGNDGLLTLPGGNVTIGSVLGGEAILASNTPFGVVSQGNGSTVLQWIDDIANATALSAIYINSPSGNTGDVAVLTGEPGANANIWTFGADGILTVPGDLVAVSASPAPVISGFSSANFAGNVTANYFLGNGSQLTNLPAPSVAQDITSNGAMSIMTYDGNLKYVNYATVEPSSGNIAGGNISASGNITANNFIGNGNTLSNVAIKTSGSWTLASGTNTVSISVPGSGTYAIWVNGNIPNGIITYTATAVVTNTNVPVLGSQYAWYYAVGNALVFTSIPDQFVGTVGSISNVNTYVGNTANVFTFGITNNSGSTAVVNYGYTKL